MSILLETIASSGDLQDMIQDPAKTVEKANEFVQNLKDFVPNLIRFGINVIIALIIFAIGKFIIKFLLKLCKRFFDRAKVEISVSKFLLSLIRATSYVILLIIVLDTVGIKTTSFIAVLGTAGLAVGLSIQGSLANFAGGVLILLLKPFKVGDYIIESSSGKEGTVSKIDIFYTTLVTLDNRKIVIPNGNLSNSSLINTSAFDTRRIDISVGISYSADIAKAKRLLEDIAKNHEYVLKDKEIFSFVSELDSSQVTLCLRIWTLSSNYWTTKYELTEQIKNEFDNNGIEIPFNQLVVHMDTDNK